MRVRRRAAYWGTGHCAGRPSSHITQNIMTFTARAERGPFVVLGVLLHWIWTARERWWHVRTKGQGLELHATASRVATQRPNVVIVLLDDAGAGDAGALGHPLLRTPHIDRFASAAVSFSQSYAGAPNCSPSRASLLTGRAAYRTGVYDFLSQKSGSIHFARGERTIAALTRASGYATGHWGKWHLSRRAHGYSPHHFGFEYSNGSFLAASALLRDFGGWLRHGRAANKPFFAYLALWEPHEPVHYWSPRRMRRLYAQPASHAGPRGVSGVPGADGSPWPPRYGSLEELAPAVASGGGVCVWRLAQRNPARIYYGAMSQVDESFGWMLAELDRQRLRDDTLVVLTSDNGPEHRELNSWGSSGGLRGAKGYVYEGGIRVPLLLQWPAVIHKPNVIDEPVHLWDLLPTICEAAGIALPTDRVLDGVSLLKLLISRPNEHLVATSGERGDEGEESTKLDQAGTDPAALAAAAELIGQYVRTQPYTEPLNRPVLPRPQPSALPLPRPRALPGNGHSHLQRETPLFWAMHRGRGGMQYALRSGPWKLIGGCAAHPPAMATAYPPAASHACTYTHSLSRCFRH